MLEQRPHMAAVGEVEVHGGHERQVERKVAPVALRLQRAPLACVQRGVRADHCRQVQNLKGDLTDQKSWSLLADSVAKLPVLHCLLCGWQGRQQSEEA